MLLHKGRRRRPEEKQLPTFHLSMGSTLYSMRVVRCLMLVHVQYMKFMQILTRVFSAHWDLAISWYLLSTRLFSTWIRVHRFGKTLCTGWRVCDVVALLCGTIARYWVFVGHHRLITHPVHVFMSEQWLIHCTHWMIFIPPWIELQLLNYVDPNQINRWSMITLRFWNWGA